MLKEIREFYGYNGWANRRMLDVVSAVGSDELQRDLSSSFASIQGTLAHILSAEWVWLERWTGTSPSGIPEDWDLSSIPKIRERWREVDSETAEFLSGLTEESLGEVLHYRNTAGEPFAEPLWQLLFHVVNHSSYHRGQVTTLLRQSGLPAVSTDFVLFCRERL